MKTMPVLLLLIVLLLPRIITAQARQFPDSIRIELPEHGATIVFEMRMYTKDKNIIRTFPAQLGEISEHIKKSIAGSQWQDAHRVTVTPDKTDAEKRKSHILITKKNDDVTRLLVQESTMLELLPPGWDLTIRMERCIIHVYAPDLAALEKVSQLNLEPVIAYLATENEFVVQQRMGVYTRLVMRDNHITPAGATGHLLPADMLGLHAGAGVGMLGARLYPEFNFITAIYLANRFHNNRQRIAAGYELKLFSAPTAENALRSTPASFVTLSYGINFSGKRPRWTALGVGYMVHNRSDLFTGKTMKLFLESDIGSDKLNIVPELYLTDDFRKSVFGIKLNYKF